MLLAAGAIGSPQLLMLSGIGPAEHLREVGLDVRHDLPGVGENLQDHPFITVLWEVRRHAHALRRRQAQAHGRMAAAPLAAR